MFIDGNSGGNFGGWKGKTPKSPREITLKKNKIQTFPKGDGGRGQGGLRIRQHNFEHPNQIPVLCGGVFFVSPPLPPPIFNDKTNVKVSAAHYLKF